VASHYGEIDEVREKSEKQRLALVPSVVCEVQKADAKSEKLHNAERCASINPISSLVLLPSSLKYFVGIGP